MKNELEGFVIFRGARSGYDLSVAIVVTGTGISLTEGAFQQCGSPEYINVFFDDTTKRMMIKKADKKTPNVFKIAAKHINSISVRTKLMHLAGCTVESNKAIRFDGHNPDAPNHVIFDLEKYQIVK